MRSHAHDFYLGLDLGKLRDSTALVLLERYSTRQGWDPYYLCEVYRWKTVIRLAERVPLGTSYPAVVERVRAVIDQLAARGPVHLTVDATGVGQAVVDALREAKLKCHLVPVTITGAEHATRVRGGFAVPKEDLIVGLQMMFSRGDLLAPAKLPLRTEMMNELLKMGRNLRAIGSGHDDLVLALSLAAWTQRENKSIGERNQRIV